MNDVVTTETKHDEPHGHHSHAPALTGCPWHDVNEMLQSVGLRPTRQRMALGWLLFGKTGSGYARLEDGTLDRSRPFGWFVGFARKDGHTVVFARFTSLDMASPESLGLVARRQVVGALPPVLSAIRPE